MVYWLPQTARISEAVVPSLFDQLKAIGPQERLDLVLYTFGGDTEIPIRIVTLLREFCKKLSVLIPYRANSSGTLLAMGADEIVMTPLSALGPIDPSRTHPLLPKREGATESEPVSVQDMQHAMQFIRQTGADEKGIPYTPEALAQVFTALFDKIHPLAIGAIEQSYSLAKLVGTKCLATHLDPEADAAKIKAIVDRLCDNYKSHSYQIDRREAQRIGLNVAFAPTDLETALNRILELYLARPMLPSGTPKEGQQVRGILAWLESTSLHLRVEATYRHESGQLKLIGDQWVKY